MKLFYKSVIPVAVLCLASCSAPKKVSYVLDAETIPTEVLTQNYNQSEAILSAGDLLNICVTSSDMQAVAVFNKGLYVDEKGSISRVQTTSQNNSNNYETSTEYFLVSQDGTIDFPVIGSINAAGMSKMQLAEEITNAIYPKYVKDKPIVEVRLMNFRVVVTGAVKSPGIYKSPNERMNFFEAISMAGDLDIKGDRENILLYRLNYDGTREVHKLDIHDKSFMLSPYFTLQQNDVIYVTPNKYMQNNAWQLNPGVAATITYISGISSVASLVIGIINLATD